MSGAKQETAPNGASQWESMFQSRTQGRESVTHSRTGSLVQVSDSTTEPSPVAPRSPGVIVRPPGTATAAAAPAVAPAAAPAPTAGAAAQHTGSNTLQESISYVTQASQNELVTVFHEMQKVLNNQETEEGTVAQGAGAQSTPKEEPSVKSDPGVKSEPA